MNTQKTPDFAPFFFFFFFFYFQPVLSWGDRVIINRGWCGSLWLLKHFQQQNRLGET